MILKKFISGPLQTNTMLLVCEDTKKAAAIDPSDGSSVNILSYVKANNLTLDSILLTHSHFDHIGDVLKIRDETNAKVYIHSLDSDTLKHPGSDGLPLLEKVDGIEADHLLSDGDKLQIGNIDIEVIHTPGHSPGSTCFYIPKQNVLLSGDTLFAGSIGNISFPTSNPDLMWPSLKKLSKLPPITKVYPGHGPRTSIGDESWLNNAKEVFGY